MKFIFFPVDFINKITQLVIIFWSPRPLTAVATHGECMQMAVTVQNHSEVFKFPVFFQNFQIPCVFPVWNYFSQFSQFSLCSGNPAGQKRHHQMSIYGPNIQVKSQHKALIFGTYNYIHIWHILLYSQMKFQVN